MGAYSGFLDGSEWAVCNKKIHAGGIIFRVGRCDGTVNPCGKPGTGAGWKDWPAWGSKHNDALNSLPIDVPMP